MRNYVIGGELQHLDWLKKYFSEDISFIQCQSSKEVVEAVFNNSFDYGIIPIENKHLGSFLTNYVLIEETGLNIIGEVYSNSTDWTKFYILSKGEDFYEFSNGSSINLYIKHYIGSLSDVLMIIKKWGVNITKIQSIPVDVDTFSFHLDIEYDNREVLSKTIKEISSCVEKIAVLGIYKKAEISF
jgi:prephenate dehydratase